MKPHVKLYRETFGYDVSDWTPCEVCGALATDVHHIESRGMGGTTQAERIENLMGLCRKHHDLYGDKKQYKDWLFTVHRQKMVDKGIKFDAEWLMSKI